MKDSKKSLAIGTAGFAVSIAMMWLSLSVSRIGSSFWVGAAFLTVAIFIYYMVVHPRIRGVPGFEYAALHVGINTIFVIALIFGAVAHYKPI